jgi:tetratricopeptide (TPR) repeat protein
MKFDSIQLFFPMHGLQDEILFRKASAFQYQGRWKEAIELLESIILKYNDDILADDAIFELAKIYEYHLFNKEKAAEYYKKIVIDYKGSLFSIEARKKLRFLRGDVLEDGIPPN